jgi:hypothetical protein
MRANLDIQEFFQLATGERSGPIYVCNIERNLKEVIGSTTRAVWLSKYTLDKQLHRHPEMMPELYAHVPYIVQNGICVLEKRNHLSFLLNATAAVGYWMKACIKASCGGSEIYLVTFHKCRQRDVKRVLAKGIIVRNGSQ